VGKLTTNSGSKQPLDEDDFDPDAEMQGLKLPAYLRPDPPKVIKKKGRPPGSRNKDRSISPKIVAALTLKSAGASTDVIMKQCGFPTKDSTYRAMANGRKRFQELGLKDPIEAARGTVVDQLVPLALDAYKEAMGKKNKRYTIKIIAATNTLKGAQVFVGKQESEQTQVQIKNEIETKRLEIAFERKLIDKFNLDIEPSEAEVITNQLTGD
jgi:hypothetical protein